MLLFKVQKPMPESECGSALLSISIRNLSSTMSTLTIFVRAHIQVKYLYRVVILHLLKYFHLTLFPLVFSSHFAVFTLPFLPRPRLHQNIETNPLKWPFKLIAKHWTGVPHCASSYWTSSQIKDTEFRLAATFPRPILHTITPPLPQQHVCSAAFCAHYTSMTAIPNNKRSPS